MPTSTAFSLFKRSNGVWYALYTVGGKRFWKSTHCTERRAALKAAKATDLSRQDPLPAATPEIPENVNAYLEQYLAYAQATYQRRTHDLYLRVSRHLASLVGSRPLGAVTAKAWDDYTILRLRQVTAVSVNMEQRALKALMNKAVEWEYLDKSPFAKSKKIRVPEAPPRYFQKQEFERLLKLVEEEWLRSAIVFSISTGVRRGELINLRWVDVDLARRTILIQNAPNFKVKGNKTRIVPLSSVALEIILRQKKSQNCPYVFTLNRHQIDGNWMSGLFRRYVKKAGLYEKKLHWHNLRSSFASWLVSGGVSLYAVSKLLGHSTTVLTQNHYARLAPETLHATVELLREDLPAMEVK